MKINNIIKAFTLLESLITILLISVIIALTYGLVNLVNKQMTLFEKENVEVLEYNLFNSSLKLDIFKSIDYDFTNKELFLKFYEDEIVNYKFYKDFVLREKNQTMDTFHLKMFNLIKSNGIDNCCDDKDVLHIDIKLLSDTISSIYILDKNSSSQINRKLFDEN